jgi:hypothetical protein
MWTSYLTLKDSLAILVLLLTEFGIRYTKRTASGIYVHVLLRVQCLHCLVCVLGIEED